ncbi:hypothetical protein DESC_780317 [Desulfosarcina cetonica]|nr:hypothetical protein DESC_780317 [Desulfosarcina cetonica]
MQGTFAFGKEKIVHQGSIAQYGLGADTRRIGPQIGKPHRRAVLLYPSEVAAPEERVAHLAQTGFDIGADHLPEAGKAQHLQAVGRIEVDPTVAFAFPSQNGIGADGDPSVDHAGQVNAQKGQPRVGNRIDQVAETALEDRCEGEVLPAEGNDLKIDGNVHHARQAIGHQPAAGHEITAVDTVFADGHPDPVGFLMDGGDRTTGADPSPQGGELPGQGGRDAGVVRDAGGRHEKRGLAGDMGFAAFQRVPGKPFGMDPVQPATLLQVRHAGHLQGIRGHEQFAALRDRQAVLSAKCQGDGCTAPAEVGLQASRGVVDAGVDHTRVATGLVAGQTILFLDQ